MGSGSGLDLGDVGFSLSADTAGLDKALATLRRFGDEVNKWERKTDESSQTVTAAYMRQEKAMVGMYQKMQSLHAQMRRVEAPAGIADKATSSLQRYIDKLSEASKTGAPVVRNALEMQRAMAAASGEYSKAVNSLKDWQIQTRNAAKAQEELNKQLAIASKGRMQQAIGNIPTPATGKSAKASAQIFADAGLLSADQNAHVTAYRVQQAAVDKLTTAYGANANAHVKAYQTRQVAMQREAAQFAANSNAHVDAYRIEMAAIAKRDAALKVSSNNALIAAKTRANALRSAGERSFAPDNMLAGYNTALQQFQTKVTAGVGSSAGLKKAQLELASSFNKTTQEIKNYTAAQTAASRAEKMAASATHRVSRTNDMAQRFNVPSSYTKANTVNLQAYQQALFSGDNNKTQTTFGKLNAGLKETQGIIAKSTQGAQKFSSALRGVESATILAAGPLSGFGARTAVIATLFESMSAKAALLVVGLTAVGVTIGLTATAAVKARIAYEQWNSMLIAASGSIALAGGEMEYVTEVANKYGFAVQGLVPSYASFATSARLANVSLKEQRDIFESFTTAGAALHWTTEQSGRAFLALEQMMSKGVIQTQEMKLQLGQVLPGAMEIAAKAVGMTTGQFMKAMEKGEVKTKDSMGAIAAEIKKVYDAAAKYGAISIQADIGRFSTGKFEMAKAFDEVIGASKIFQGLLQNINSAMGWMAANADKAVAGFVSGIAVLATSFLPLAITGMAKLVAHMKTMTILGSTMAAFSSGNIVKGVLQLGVMAGVGYGVYKLLNQALGETNSKTQEVINNAAIAASQYDALGEITKREKEAHLKLLDEEIAKVNDRISQIHQETEATLLLARSVTAVSEAERQRRIANINGQAKQKMGTMSANPMLFANGLDTEMYEPTPEAKDRQKAQTRANIDATPEGKARLAAQALQKQLNDLQALKDKLASTKEAADPASGVDTKAAAAAEKARAKYEGVHNAVKKMFTELDMVTGKQRFIDLQYKIAPISEEELMKAFDRKEAEKEVADFFEGMKDKTKNSFVQKLSAEYKGLFEARGIAGNTLEERLVNLKVKTKETDRALEKNKRQLIENGLAADRAALGLQNFTDATKSLQRESALLEAGLKGQTSADALSGQYDIEDKMREARARIYDAVLATDASDPIVFSARIDLAEGELERLRAAANAQQSKELTLGRLSGIEDTVSATETSTQSLVVAGVLSESQARTKVRNTMREQITASGDLLERMEELRALAVDPAEIAAYDARIARLKEMAAIGAQIGTQAGVSAAMNAYANETIDAFQQAHDVTLKLMKGMEDAIVEFAMTGKLSVSEMAKSIIADLIRIQARQMVTSSSGLLKTAFNATVGYFTGGIGGAATALAGGAAPSSYAAGNEYAAAAAQGQAFAGPGISAYSNSIVTKPTVFPFAKGIGLMGEESGAPGEAVMPLTRDGSGDLAVSAVGLKGLGGAGNISVTVQYIDQRQTGENTTGSGSTEEKTQANKFNQLMKTVVINTIMQEKRPGGLLA